MTVTAPAGAISLAQNYLRVTLADSATFRTWVGATDRSGALLHIHDDALPAPRRGEYTLTELRSLRPYVLVSTIGLTWTRDAVSDAFEFRGSGRLPVRFVQDVDPAITLDEAEMSRTFQNTIGQIIDDIVALAGQPGYLAIERVTLDAGWSRSHKSEYRTEGDVQWWDATVEWGRD
ncbi:MAG: hypothetical protein ACE5E6_09410 [Phycisphaerae bacterium]